MNNTFLLFYSPKPRNQVWILMYRKCSIVTFLVFTLNGDVFIVILVAYFSPKSRGKQKSAIFSTKKIWKVTIYWLGMENGCWFEKTRLHLIANLRHYVVLFLFQIHLFILLPNSCIVVSRVGLVSSLGTPHRDTHGWAYVKRCSLRLCFLIQSYFLFHCINYKMKSRRSQRRWFSNLNVPICI